MTNLLRYAESDQNAPWLEDDLQMAMVRELRRLRVCHAADQNAGRRSLRDGARRKALGMVAGETDLRLYLPGARTVFIEVKLWSGTVSGPQKERHAELRALGFDVYVVKAKTPADAIAQLLDILARHRYPKLTAKGEATNEARGMQA